MAGMEPRLRIWTRRGRRNTPTGKDGGLIKQMRGLGEVHSMKLRSQFASKRISESSSVIDGACHAAPFFARRGILAMVGTAVLAVGGGSARPALAGSNAADTIQQPTARDDTAFMGRAFEMRRIAVEKGDQAYGALLVRDGEIIGQSWSRVILDNDPTAHAEMAAIRNAARRQNNRNLDGAIMYSSSRPCPMCEAAAYWAGIGQMIYGRDMTKAGSPRLCR